MQLETALVSDQIGDKKWRFHSLGIVIEAETKDEADAIVTKITEAINAAEPVEGQANTWKYPAPIGSRISGEDRNAADRAAASRALVHFARHGETGAPEEKEEEAAA